MKKDEGVVIWFTGVPASGKSTIAAAVEKQLHAQGLPVENLDADEVRANLSPDLGYTAEARDANTKRLAWMSQMLSKHGVNVIVAAVSPLRSHRDRARQWCPKFVEVFVDCPLGVCQERDPKGLYARAARGEVNDIAGMHMPYEAPNGPEVHCPTHLETVQDCTGAVLAKLKDLGYLAQSPLPYPSSKRTKPR